jgi:hypothetical protein
MNLYYTSETLTATRAYVFTVFSFFSLFGVHHSRDVALGVVLRLTRG